MKIIRYILILSLLLHYSCDDFLNVKPEGEVVNDELFKNSEGFEDALYGVYSFLGRTDLYGQNLTYYVNDVAAQYLIGSWDQDPSHKLSQYNYKHSEVRPIIDNIWIYMYKNIANVNNILANLALKDENSMQLYNIYKAEALGLRAFMHFEILRLFTDDITQNPNAEGIPYYTKYSFEVSPFEKSSESYKKILADLTEAERLFEVHGEYFDRTDENAGGFILDRPIHMNLYAVKAVLARVYWTMGNWGKAKEKALEVINCSFFKLEEKTNIEDLVNGVLSPKETIFGLFSDKWWETTQHQLYYTGTNSLDLQSNYKDIYSIDLDGVDYRWEGWIKEISDFGAVGLRFMKVVDRYRVKQSSRPVACVSGINLIRLPELFYIVAECYLHEEGDDAKRLAVSYFDKVLRSRGLKTFSERGYNVYTSNINDERRKEFIGEGLYFHVMKKYNMPAYNAKYDMTFQPSTDIYNFPLPEDEKAYRN